MDSEKTPDFPGTKNLRFFSVLRNCFDDFYDFIKPAVFSFTEKDPEKAHQYFVSFLRFLYHANLDEFFLDNSSNYNPSSMKISNAAGFNKNAEIPPSTMKYLGFDRVVIGTVTNEKWPGNPKPRIVRYPSTESLVNWMGLPGDGAEKIAERLSNYKRSLIPVTINLMATPGKKGDEIFSDLEETVLALRDAPNVDRAELNISCPNTHSQDGNLDARKEYQKKSKEMLSVVKSNLYPQQELYLKISPDIDYQGVEEICSIADKNLVSGFTISNTTTRHDSKYILKSHEAGGASGNAVYNASLEVQKMFEKVMNKNNMKIIACGGINTFERVQERIIHGAEEIQLYTPLIFSGPKLLRELKDNMSKRSCL